MTAPKPQRRRGPGRPFQKGVSGNPKGRPKTNQEFIDLAREGEEIMLQKLYVIGLKRDDATAIKAIELRLAYARGRPKVIAEIGGPGGGPIPVGSSSESAAVMEMLEKLAAEKKG